MPKHGLSAVRASKLTLLASPGTSFIHHFLIIFCVFGAVIVTGCQRPLYLPNDVRTQYDQYKRTRNELARPFIEDEYGRRKPNLRERLGSGG
jgi:hypothetical protein